MNRSHNYLTSGSIAFSRGVTLVELLIALVIGIFLIGGVFAVFQSNQQSYRSKMELDNAQEAFRYMSYTINRLTKSSKFIASPSDDDDDVDDYQDNVLVLRIQGGPGIRNCIGEIVPEVSNDTLLQENRFILVGSNLVCDVNGENPTILVNGVEDLSFAYGVRDNTNRVSEYHSASEIMDWKDVFSVLVNIKMESGLEVRFASSMRSQVTSDLIIVRPDTPSSPPPGGDNNDGSTPPGNGDDNAGGGDDPSIGDVSRADIGSGDNRSGGGLGACTLVTISCRCLYQSAGPSGTFTVTRPPSDARCDEQLCRDNVPRDDRNRVDVNNNNFFDFQTDICQ